MIFTNFAKLVTYAAVILALTIFFIVLIREYLADVLGWLVGLPEWQSLVLFVLMFVAVSFPMMWGFVQHANTLLCSLI